MLFTKHCDVFICFQLKVPSLSPQQTVHENIDSYRSTKKSKLLVAVDDELPKMVVHGDSFSTSKTSKEDEDDTSYISSKKSRIVDVDDEDDSHDSIKQSKLPEVEDLTRSNHTQPDLTTFMKSGLVSGTAKSYYRFYVSKTEINKLSCDDKLNLESNVDTFLRSQKPMISILKSKADKKHFNNTIDDGRCGVYFIVQARDRVYDIRKDDATKHKYSKDVEFFTESVKWILSRVKDDDDAIVREIQANLNYMLEWTLCGDTEALGVINYFDTKNYHHINFPEELKFIFFTECSRIFDYETDKLDKSLKDWLLLNFTNMFNVDYTEGYVKATLDNISMLSNCLAGQLVKDHVFILPEDWKVNFNTALLDESTSIINKVSAFIKSNEYCPSSFKYEYEYYSTTLNYINDLSRLRPGGWLNDNIIGTWLSHIQEEYSNQQQCEVFFFPFGDAYLNSDNSTELEPFLRWFKHVSYSLDLIKYVVWVINVKNTHWVFLIISMSDFSCRICDSLASGKNIGKELTRKATHAFYLTIGAFHNLLPKKYPKETPAFNSEFIDLTNVQSYPQQRNSYDCGIYTLYGIRDFLQDTSTKFNFNQEMINEYREHMLRFYLDLFADK